MENYGDQITFVGAFDNQLIDVPGTSEEKIRMEIRTKLEKYVDKKRYIPLLASKSETVMRIYNEEMVRVSSRLDTMPAK